MGRLRVQPVAGCFLRFNRLRPLCTRLQNYLDSLTVLTTAVSAFNSNDAKLPALTHHRRIRREQVVVSTDTASARTAGRNNGRVGQSIPGRFNEQQAGNHKPDRLNRHDPASN